jgi:DNA-directed RNA polymerase specialized sigma24 family protein
MSAPELPRPRERAHGVERRARKVLERDYERLRAATCSAVERKLARLGARVDPADIDPAYNLAWQALYAKLAAGDEVENPAGFLTQATFFRVVDEHRGRRGDRREDVDPATLAAPDRDIEDRLDDERRLRELAEGMRARLGERERRAAVLCYLHGYSRDEAADELGIRASRMQKVMDRASKVVRSVVEEVSGDEWCTSQRSLITAYALGVLEQGGPRHVLAREHLRECSGCRARVLALRGIGAAVPPIVLPWAAVGLSATQVPAVLGGTAAVGGASAVAGAGAAASAGGTATAAGGGGSGLGGLIAGVGTQAGLVVGTVASVAAVATAAAVLPGGGDRKASAAPTTTAPPVASAPAATPAERHASARGTRRALRATGRDAGRALRAGGTGVLAAAPSSPATVAAAPTGEPATTTTDADPATAETPPTTTGPSAPTTTDESPTTTATTPDDREPAVEPPAAAEPTPTATTEPTPTTVPAPTTTATSLLPTLPTVSAGPGGLSIAVPVPGQGTSTVTLGGPNGLAVVVPPTAGLPGIKLP